MNPDAPSFRPRPWVIVSPEPKPEQVDLVISHAWCMDGFGAVLAFRLWHRKRHAQALIRGEAVPEFKEPDYIFMGHKDPEREMPDVAGRHVAIFDYSLPQNLMIHLSTEAASWTLWDHHCTAQDALQHHFPRNCHFDMQRSGAVLAWRYLFGEDSPEKPLPMWLRYVQDRDLWRWALPYSRAISKYFWHQLGLSLDAWELFFQQHALESAQMITASTWGAVVLDYETVIVRQVCARAWDNGTFLGHKAACAFTSALPSEVCEQLLINAPSVRVAIAIQPDGSYPPGQSWRFSVRTRNRAGQAGPEDDVSILIGQPAQDHPNVGVLCKALGGGGHACAAGFHARYDDPRLADLFPAAKEPSAPAQASPSINSIP